MFYWRDWFLIPFSVLWCGFAVFSTWIVWLQDAPWFTKIWGGAFVLIGLFFVFGRFLVDAYIRANLTYAVTNERLLVMSRRTITSHSLRILPQVTFTEGKQGKGTIKFGQPLSMTSLRFGFEFWLPVLNKCQFINVKDGQKVYRLILRAQMEQSAA